MSRHELTPVQQLHLAAKVLREHGHNGDAYSVERIAAKLETPIDMILHCPACLEQHIDAPDEPDKYCVTTPDGGCASTDPRCMHQEEPAPRWTNPPHRSHLCKHCGFIWRPADVATNGVAEIKTKGKDDMVLFDGPLEVMRQLRIRDAAKPKLDWEGDRP